MLGLHPLATVPLSALEVYGVPFAPRTGREVRGRSDRQEVKGRSDRQEVKGRSTGREVKGR